MTQEEWLTATDPMQMLGHLGNNICNRKVLVVAGVEVGRFAVDESIRDPAGGPSHGVERPPSNGATLGWDLPRGCTLDEEGDDAHPGSVKAISDITQVRHRDPPHSTQRRVNQNVPDALPSWRITDSRMRRNLSRCFDEAASLFTRASRCGAGHVPQIRVGFRWSWRSLAGVKDEVFPGRVVHTSAGEAK